MTQEVIQTFQVKVYPKLGFYWKSQAIILLIFLVAALVLFFILPNWIVKNRFFYLLAMVPIIYFVYTQYFDKQYNYVEEPLTISKNTLSFRNKIYSKNDIRFYRHKVRGATYGSVIKLGLDFAFVCNNMDLPDYSMYERDYSGTHINLAIEQDAFNALCKIKFS